MDTLRSAVLCICCGAIGLSMTTEMLASERFRRQMRFLAMLLLLTAGLTQLRALDLSAFSGESGSITQTAGEIAERAKAAEEAAAAEAVCRSLNRSLQEHQVPCQVNAVSLHISKNGGIVVDRAYISGNLLTGRVWLREWLGADTEITEGGETDAG